MLAGHLRTRTPNPGFFRTNSVQSRTKESLSARGSRRHHNGQIAITLAREGDISWLYSYAEFHRQAMKDEHEPASAAHHRLHRYIRRLGSLLDAARHTRQENTANHLAKLNIITALPSNSLLTLGCARTRRARREPPGNLPGCGAYAPTRQEFPVSYHYIHILPSLHQHKQQQIGRS